MTSSSSSTTQQQHPAGIEVINTKDLDHKTIDYKHYIRRSALDSDFKTLIKKPVIIVDEKTNTPIIVYLVVKDLPQTRMVQILKSLEYARNKRIAGLVTNSKIFGFMPREQIRKDYCNPTAFARDNPVEHDYICNYGGIISRYYKAYCPEIFNDHMKLSSEKILPEWKIKGSPFTSGIINKNNYLKYHKDAGNISGVYSNMVCFRNEVEGGHLAIPEYDIGLEIANKSLLFFDGQKIMHGVTPFRLKSSTAYRFTIVYYTLKRMWQCKPITEELARIKQRKYERELKRYQRLITGSKEDKIV